MGDWSEFYRRAEALEESEDEERLRLIEMYYEAVEHRETNPEYRLSLLTIARNDARRLKESWWEIFLESWRLTTLASDLHDFTRARPLAMELMVEIHRESIRGHSSSHDIHTNALYTFLQVDPLGHEQDLERGFRVLDEQISREPVSDRFVLYYRKTEYLCEIQRWNEALELALDFEDFVNQGKPSAWWKSWVIYLICRISSSLQRLDMLESYSQQLVECSRDQSQLLRAHVAGLIWNAVVQRINGNEDAAQQNYEQGMDYLRDLETGPEICSDSLVRYHCLAGDWSAAIQVYDTALASIARKGMWHRECMIHIERCWLSGKLGSISEHQIEQAQIAIARMKTPQWYLARLKIACEERGR